MKVILTLFLVFSFSLLRGETLPPEDGLNRLLQGNTRYKANASKMPNKEQQTPFAVIVGCSDSRVAPEIIFDEDLGTLFVVRVAGNVIGSIEMESIQYGVDSLGAGVVLVLGHENCGAIRAVVEGKAKSIPSITKLIDPSVLEAKKISFKNLLENAIKANALRMRDVLLDQPIFKNSVESKKVQIQAGYFNFQTGTVEILGK